MNSSVEFTLFNNTYLSVELNCLRYCFQLIFDYTSSNQFPELIHLCVFIGVTENAICLKWLGMYKGCSESNFSTLLTEQAVEKNILLYAKNMCIFKELLIIDTILSEALPDRRRSFYVPSSNKSAAL